MGEDVNHRDKMERVREREYGENHMGKIEERKNDGKDKANQRGTGEKVSTKPKKNGRKMEREKNKEN